MLQRPGPAVRAGTLLLLVLLLTACASTPLGLPPTPAPAIPPLPPSARQPAPLDLCSPTCSAAWKRTVESLLPRPTGAASPAASASSAMTR